jgi:hypothetical protein
MSVHSQEQFLATVAAALGESISLIRRRGFRLELEPLDLDPRPARGSDAATQPIDDAVDLAACGLDWDADNGYRIARRRRRGAARRRAA